MLNVQGARQSLHWLSQWSGLNHGATPLIDLPGLARDLGLGSIQLKDESQRSPLGASRPGVHPSHWCA